MEHERQGEELPVGDVLVGNQTKEEKEENERKKKKARKEEGRKKIRKRRVLDSGRRTELHRHCQQSSSVLEPGPSLPGLVSLGASQGLEEAGDKVLWGFNPNLPFTFH